LEAAATVVMRIEVASEISPPDFPTVEVTFTLAAGLLWISRDYGPPERRLID